ncbi:DUF461 domain-containing protein [Streptomyces sp. P1-3]|uniref:DUF461 domain-containing protein n=1 Tax=Streptomyces sp. P1-3 TaxID=3421658 RepID=UPI003D36C5D4
MSSDLRRGALAATALVLSLAPLSACGAGNDAQSLEIKPDNAATSVGNIKIQNVTVVTQPDRKTKGPAVITARIFNNGDGPQALKAITVGDTKVKLSPAKGTGELIVPEHGELTLGGKGNAAAVIENGREAARDGDAQSVVFDFNKTGEVELKAFVVPATSYFDKWGPEKPPAPKPTQPATPTTPAGTPTGTAPASPGGEAGDKNPGKPNGSTVPAKPNGTATTPPQGQGIASGEPDPNGHAGH